MTSASKERRLKILWVSEDEIWTVLQGWRECRLVARVVNAAPVPPDAELDGVCHSWERRAFGLRLAHPSFDVVPDGDYVPDLDAAALGGIGKLLRHHAVRVEAGADGADPTLVIQG